MYKKYLCLTNVIEFSRMICNSSLYMKLFKLSNGDLKFLEKKITSWHKSYEKYTKKKLMSKKFLVKHK